VRARLARLTLAGLLAAAAAVAAEEAWYPSKYGAGDTLGALNELSPELVLAAAKLVRTGKTYRLGVETGRDTPAFGARSFSLYAVPAGDGSGAALGSNRATWNDDWMLTWLGIGTQIDGLGHFGIDHVYYNGSRVEEIFRPTGLAKLATHELPAIATRGVLLDVARHRGVERLAAGDVISRAEIQAIEKAQATPVARGDVVLLHTGWQQLAQGDRERFLAGEPGLDADSAEYLAGRRVVAVGADTWGLDVLPHPDPGQVFPAHQVLLAKHGVYVLENVQTAELAADGSAPFLFVLGVPRFVGAVQMVVNPVAIR
jgi:kynurenine formamidase